ncbi:MULTISPECIES: response regulator [unclassified Paenibacillus]|uniref:response regulator n=1 Tax=unclassified Paenibacillus TaxID=185978 RepID=UPI000CFAE726|nr:MULTISPECIES: response regulator [unclassified Paenibacillus]PQZ98452.1 two-component system response regulator [Paenibacillus sp. MYb63]PRA42668.1 two-component system response regulator [Paenibacillus sp. MYb67]QZN77277.1 response regulator [Paenibacillus sp. DR312]
MELTLEPLKVLIVDDEYLIRNLLRMRIDWEQQGMFIVGEASDAAEALDQVELLRPDIVFTDIYMPKMDGIELSGILMERYPNIKIVVVTGHDEFEYARQSVKLGISDFILKPIRASELLQVTTKLRALIKQEVGREYELMKLREEMEQSLPYLRERFVNQWLSHMVPEDELHEKARFFGIPISSSEPGLRIAVMEVEGVVSQGKITEPEASPHLSETSHQVHEAYQALQPHQFSQVQREPQQDQTHLSQHQTEAYRQTAEEIHILLRMVGMKQVQAFYPQDSQTIIVMDPHNRIVVLSLGTDTEFANQVQQLQEELQHTLKFEGCEVDVTVGIGQWQSGWGKACVGYREACRALDYQAFVGKNQVICFEDLVIESGNRPYHSNAQLLQQLQFNVSVGAGEEAVLLLERMLSVPFSDVSQFRMAAMDVVTECQRAAIEQQLEGEDALNKEAVAAIFTANHLPELKSMLEQHVRTVSDVIQAKRQAKEGNLIDRVMAYLEENMGNTEVGLSSTAAAFYVSSGHLGRLMKKETGQTFVEYLTQLRMKKAELLLKQTDMKGYEIGEQVGIPDPHYFSVLFKKHIGRSMNEYRNVKT